MFIAFCEDRGLLPEKTIPKAYTSPAFTPSRIPAGRTSRTCSASSTPASEPRHSRATTAGCSPRTRSTTSNSDDPWTNFFHYVSDYDFADEVNLDVLGHLFERSITELEKLKTGGLFGDAEKAEALRHDAAVGQAQAARHLLHAARADQPDRPVHGRRTDRRALRGSWPSSSASTPEEAARGIVPDDERLLARLPRHPAQPENRRSRLRLRRVSVPGLQRPRAPLPRSHRPPRQARRRRMPTSLPTSVPHFILQREPLRRRSLARSGRDHATGPLDSLGHRGQTLATLSRNIVHGNSLVHDPAVHPAGFDWHERFPEVFQRRLLAESHSTPPHAHLPRANPASIASSAIRRGNGSSCRNASSSRCPPRRSPPPRTRPSADKLVAKLESRRSRAVTSAIRQALAVGRRTAHLLPHERTNIRSPARATSTPTRCSPNWPINWSPRTAASGCSRPRASRPTRRPRISSRRSPKRIG